MTWERREPGVWVEPVLIAFERESEWLIGPRRKRESAEEAMRRVVRIRELLRLEQTVKARTRDGGCLLCDECDRDESHAGPCDCGHEEHR